MTHLGGGQIIVSEVDHFICVGSEGGGTNVEVWYVALPFGGFREP